MNEQVQVVIGSQRAADVDVALPVDVANALDVEGA
jgi:hypothetical protein